MGNLMGVGGFVVLRLCYLFSLFFFFPLHVLLVPSAFFFLLFFSTTGGLRQHSWRFRNDFQPSKSCTIPHLHQTGGIGSALHFQVEDRLDPVSRGF